MNVQRNKFLNLSRAEVFRTRTDFVRTCLKGKKVRVLDVGNLGDGPQTVAIRDVVGEQGGEYVGLDVNENLAKSIGAKNQLIGDLHNLRGTVADESFDCIYAGQIIEHSWRPGEMIRECARILRDGGTLILDTPNVYDLRLILRVMFKRTDTLGDVPELTYHEARDNFETVRSVEKRLESQPQHKVFYGPASLRQLLNMNGFALERIVYIDKSRGLMRFLTKLFPQCSQKIGIVARKTSVDRIFGEKQFGDA